MTPTPKPVGKREVIGEVVTGSGTSWTLDHVPKSSTLQLHLKGLLLVSGAASSGYTLSSTTVTTTETGDTGDLLASYKW